MPLIETTGSASSKALGLNSASQQLNYIEDVFSTYLYAGNGSTQTITNGIDLAGKGGLVWIKNRNNAGQHHALTDTARGVNNPIYTDLTNAQNTGGGQVSAFNANGFSLNGAGDENYASGYTYASWTFRKQPKFFDVVTWTGNGTAGRTVAHNLGSVPGCIIIKSTSLVNSDWQVFHRMFNGGTNPWNYSAYLNSTGAAYSYTGLNNTAPTSTEFTLGSNGGVNQNGSTYVAYLFAHDAGGFGTAGTDNVISCGSYSGNTSGVTINLGYEAQWVMIKRTDVAGNWSVWDVMRGMPTAAVNGSGLYPNTTDAETAGGNIRINPTATGFAIPDASSFVNITGGTYIYIAIRRGPMKTPTSGTSVLAMLARTGTSADATLTSGFPVDATLIKSRSTTYRYSFSNRLVGAGYDLNTAATDAEYSTTTIGVTGYASNTGITIGTGSYINDSTQTFINWFFRRAPSFMDVVCYTGNGANRTLNHNLGVVPELMIVKARSVAGENWVVYHSALGATKGIILNSASASFTYSGNWNNTAPTSTLFTVGTETSVNRNSATFVNYLFASCPGVSKVGSYTGTGANQTIDCGFPSGVRWVLIKRSDTAGDWYVYDTTRGMTSGTDPYILLNSIAAEVTGTNYVETIATGFRLIGSNASTNANGGTYLYLAIA